MTTNFTNYLDAINFIVKHVYRGYPVITHLNRLVLDTGEVITDMPILRYMVVEDIDKRGQRTLNMLEFRDGPVYDHLTIDRFEGVVVSRNKALGVVSSVDIDVTYTEPECTPCTQSIPNGYVDAMAGFKECGGDCDKPSFITV